MGEPARFSLGHLTPEQRFQTFLKLGFAIVLNGPTRRSDCLGLKWYNGPDKLPKGKNAR